MHYAYLDESGDVTPLHASGKFMVVAIVTGDRRASRSIELHLKRLRKKLKTVGREVKAVLATPKQRCKLLQAIASEDIAIIAIILDKSKAGGRPDDPEEWYRQAVSQAAWHCADHWPQLRLILDKRYTKKALRDRLEQAIRAKLQELTTEQITIEQTDSTTSPGLQVVDYVAWSIRRKYEAADQECYDLIKERIIIEEIIEPK